MATATINYTATPSIVSATQFRVVYTCTSVVGLPNTNIFLFRRDNNNFEKVCTLAEYNLWPTTSTADKFYYRQSAVTIDYTTLDLGVAGKAAISTAVKALADAYAPYIDGFSTAQNVTHTKTT